MKRLPRTFADVRDAVYTPPPVKRTSSRIHMKVAGNPDVFKEAEGEEDYAKGDERKRGGKVKKRKALGLMTGAGVRARLDRPGRRRKFDSGGAANDDQPTKSNNATAPNKQDDDAPSNSPSAVEKFIEELAGPRSAYHTGGRARRR